MFALEPIIAARLASLPAFSGWEVRTGTQPEDRKGLPAIDVRCTGAAISDNKMGAVMVSPEWTVLLVVQRGDLAPGLIDSAFSAVILSLQNWRPGKLNERAWESMRLSKVEAPIFSDSGVAGLELSFSTDARYMAGQ